MPLSDYFPDLKGWTPVENPAAPNPSIPTPEVQVSPFLRTTIPLPFQYAPDTLKQSNRPGLSSFRIAPLPPGGAPSINSASSGVATTVVKSVTNINSELITLQTNNLNNGSQVLLNLVNGTGGVNLSNPTGGQVIVLSLIHI